MREITDALDAAGNTTAAIGKGFAIGSAGLVSLALFGAYITRVQFIISKSDPHSALLSFSLLDGRIYIGLMIGAMASDKNILIFIFKII